MPLSRRVRKRDAPRRLIPPSLMGSILGYYLLKPSRKASPIRRAASVIWSIIPRAPWA